jgi:hypothetical protein
VHRRDTALISSSLSTTWPEEGFRANTSPVSRWTNITAEISEACAISGTKIMLLIGEGSGGITSGTA